MTLTLYNTLTRKKEPFTPIDAANVRLYVCGPTVYDRPHLGNARSVVVYDVLYRLLKQLYGDAHVTYVRNITDVDDKINAAASANHEPISALTRRVEAWFHEDMTALNVLPATATLSAGTPSLTRATENSDAVFGQRAPNGGGSKKEALPRSEGGLGGGAGYMGEPHATRHIPQMIAMIEKLIANGHAYVAQGHVLFSVGSYPDYGRLSGRKLDELIAGSRVEVASYKQHPGDFVLWKPANDGDDVSSVFESPWGKGRPGWHIECSAMSTCYLGEHFDIHGGGADLMFPHHENEIAQSRCALPGSRFANVWVHNGFLTVNGEKMSKSLGNFTTVKDMLDKGVKGEVIRMALLSSKYNEPLDWNGKLIQDAKATLDKWYRIKEKSANPLSPIPEAFLAALADDLNLPKAFSLMHTATANELAAMGHLLGLLSQSPDNWFKGDQDSGAIDALINARRAAKAAKNWAEADRIRKALTEQGIVLEDRPDGTTDWRKA